MTETTVEHRPSGESRMDYGRVVRDAWDITWRYRSLWILGLFAGGAAAPHCAWGGGGGQPDTRTDPSRFSPGMPADDVSAEIASWIAANIALLATVALVLVVVGLAAFVISLIAQGGMTRAGVDALEGRPPTLGTTWAAGLRLFWRFFALWLALVLVIIAVAVLVAIVVALFAGIAGRDAQGLGVVAVILALPLLAVGLLLAIGVAIVVPLAQRAIALDDLGPIAGLRAGWRVARRNLGASFLVWILSIGLGLVAGLGFAIAIAVLAIPLVVIGFVLWSAVGWSAATAGFGIIAVLLVLATVVVLGAMLNTFFWHYWTMAYLRLSGRYVATS
jgi:hypothetical protein